VQAGAAARVLDSDPTFVARALDAIAEAGRAALTDLDHVLGLLRDAAAESDRGPQPDLRDPDRLLDGVRAAGALVSAKGPATAPRRPVWSAGTLPTSC
jgi:hypothetical protein